MPATPDDLFQQHLEHLKDALPDASSISLAAVLRFISLAEQIKNDIILVQLGNYNLSFPPNHLSPAIIKFLVASCNISEVDVPIYWSILKVAIWTSTSFSMPNTHCRSNLVVDSDAIYPPHQTCLTAGCLNHKKLMETSQRPAILYTLSRGPIATYSLGLYCDACHMSFHNAYYVNYGVVKHDRMRTYYGNVPSILHVGGHQYVEVDLACLWRMQSVLAWYVILMRHLPHICRKSFVCPTYNAKYISTVHPFERLSVSHN
ncbi:hypothetical protein L210DRAFT_848196 [Boletus edulis BED1]|uniref:CxC5 like cysteine cluster associated with KDZ domain-containing protein n=1 Tax=Boletus edulis BED1 TaxID=1328754 RepID=A0AAD4BZK6_BOLED|nr:hypothetical protein L210DRAFT_848196 [Boletus edulis BED1]